MTVENRDTVQLESVQVRVTGDRASIRNIPPGAFKTVNLDATGESSIEVLVGEDDIHDIDIYVEPGLRGDVRVAVTRDSVLSADSEMGVWPF